MTSERIAMLNIGVSMPADIDRNEAILAGDLRFFNNDQFLLADFAGKAYDAESVKKMRIV